MEDLLKTTGVGVMTLQEMQTLVLSMQDELFSLRKQVENSKYGNKVLDKNKQFFYPGSTFTGGVFQTSADQNARRVIISGVDNKVTFYSDTGANAGFMYGLTDGSDVGVGIFASGTPPSEIFLTEGLMYLSSGSYLLYWAGSQFYPDTSNAVDIGTTSLRFKDIFLAGNLYLGSRSSTPGTASSFTGCTYYDTTKASIVFSDGSGWRVVSSTAY